MSTPTCVGNPPVRRTLYITLRGEFAIYTDPVSKMLRILAPTLPPETVTPHNFYAAGPWAGPIDIPPGTKLSLKNAIGDAAQPEAAAEIFMRLGPINPHFSQGVLRKADFDGFLQLGSAGRRFVVFLKT
jgi:hypothetical protein